MSIQSNSEGGIPPGMTLEEYVNSNPALAQGSNTALSNPNAGYGVPLDQSGGGGTGGGTGGTMYGYPDVPQRFQTYGPNGQLLPQFQLDVGKTRKVSQMGQLEMQRQREMLQSNIGDMYGRNQAAQADAMGRLAATQGLSGGAAERIGAQGVRANQSALQQMYGGHQQNMLNIRGQDIGRQIQGDQYNIGNNLSEIQRQYQGGLSEFDIKAKIMGADAAARAIAAGGGGGGGLLGGMMNPNLLGVIGGVGGYMAGGGVGAGVGYMAGNAAGDQIGAPSLGLNGQQQGQQQGGGSQYSLYGSPGQTTNPNQNQGFSMQG